MYTYEKLDGKIKMNISFTKEEWETLIEETYKRTKGKFSIQGFMKGKAPRKVIENTYGATIFMDDAMDAGVGKEYYDLLGKDSSIEPVSEPKLEIQELNDGIKATLEFDIVPELKLGDYKGLKFEKKIQKVNESEIEEKINELIEKQARFVESPEECANGDFVTLDFCGKINGVPFDGGTAENYRLEIGSHSFIEGFEEQVVGMKNEEEKDINVTFPEAYHAENLKGKPAIFTVKIHKIEKKELPKLSDKFVADTTEFETVSEYKKDIREKLQSSLDKKLERELENSIIAKIVEGSEINIPESMIESELDRFVRDFETRLKYQGLSLEDYLKYTNLTIEDLKKDKVEEAKKSVKTRLTLTKLMEKEKLQVTNEEIDAKLIPLAEKYKKSLQDYKKSMGENGLTYFVNDILMDKVFNFLKANNEIA